MSTIIDLLKQFATMLGQRFWFVVVIVIITAAALVSATFAYPISLKQHSCIVRETSYELHDITYTVNSKLQDCGGVLVELTTKEVYKSVQNNLVENPKSLEVK